jgi:predicted dehydrogenase
VSAECLHPRWSWCEGNLVGGAMFDFPGELKVYYTGSLAATGSETTWNGDIRIVGSDGTIELINDEPMIVRNNKSVERLPLPEMDYVSQAYSLHEFIRSVRDDTTPITDVKDNIRSFMMVYAAIDSARKRQRVAYGDYLKSLHTV